MLPSLETLLDLISAYLDVGDDDSAQEYREMVRDEYGEEGLVAMYDRDLI